MGKGPEPWRDWTCAWVEGYEHVATSGRNSFRVPFKAEVFKGNRSGIKKTNAT